MRLASLILLPALALPLALPALAQTITQDQQPGPQTPPRALAPQPAPPPVSAAPLRVRVPAGTRVLLALRSPISSKNAYPGAPVYAETTFPIAADNQMLIPPGSYVQGVIDAVKRPGRVKGRAQLQVHFTTLIFPNGYTVSLPASLAGAPGSEDEKIAAQEGTVTENGNKGRDAGTAATTTGTGTLIGAGLGGLKGAGIGAGVGAAAGLASVLFSRGNEIRFDVGTPLEMELQRPLVLEQDRIANLPVNYHPVPTLHTLDKEKDKQNQRRGPYVSPTSVGQPLPTTWPR